MTIINIIGVLILVSAMMVRANTDLPDPTRPADYSIALSIKQVAPKKRAEFNLNAIRVSDIDRSAIINGRLVRIGDEIGTAKVMEINTLDVVLDYERKLITIPLYVHGISKKYINSDSNN